MNENFVRLGFYAAAAFNIVGMLVFSRGLTNTTLFEVDPGLFSIQGCILVMVWGLAYLAQSVSWQAAPAISAVFALEKVFFVGAWLVWMSRYAHMLPEISAKDSLAAGFYGLYGVGDGLFALFFGWAAVRAWRAR